MKNFFKSLFGTKQESPEPETDPNIIGTSSVFPDPEPQPDASTPPAPTPDIILCIPGPWADRASFIAAMMEQHGSTFMVIGPRFVNRDADYTMDLEVCPRYPELESAFRSGGRGMIPDAELAAIAGHQSVVYLTASAGTLNDVFAASACAIAVLDAGGLGVRVDTGGAAFGPDDWRLLSEDNISFVAGYLVIVRESPGSIRSYGLRAFGLPDVFCTDDTSDSALEELANTFLKCQLFERPELKDGETFSVASDAPVYRLTRIADANNPVDIPYHNPHGLIRLTRATS